MAPSDYFLFPKLKKDLRGRKFADENELKQAVWDHFADKTSDYFLGGIKDLSISCKKCIDVQGYNI